MKKLIMIFLFLLICGLQTYGQELNKKSEPFPRILNRSKAKRSYNINIVQEKYQIRSRELTLTNGKQQVLSLPISIKNNSQNEIKTNIRHEWYGGIEPPTELQFAVRFITDGKEMWASESGYLVGDKGSNNVIIIPPGEQISIDVRLNWPGTGSCPHFPLINENEFRQYVIKILLFYKEGKSIKFVESSEMQIEVIPTNIELKE